MKTPDEIKKGLESCNKIYGCKQCPYYTDDEELSCCVERNADVLALIQQLEAAQPKWISVEEKEEPEQDGVYLCHGYWIRSGRKQTEAAEYIGEWKTENNFVLTHWMPLPEPPKEGK